MTNSQAPFDKQSSPIWQTVKPHLTKSPCTVELHARTLCQCSFSSVFFTSKRKLTNSQAPFDKQSSPSWQTVKPHLTNSQNPFDKQALHRGASCQDTLSMPIFLGFLRANANWQTVKPQLTNSQPPVDKQSTPIWQTVKPQLTNSQPPFDKKSNPIWRNSPLDGVDGRLEVWAN